MVDIGVLAGYASEMATRWVLQRLYERDEDRYLTYLWSAVHLVQDIDDTRKAGYGVYYSQKRPLTAAALSWRQKEKPGI